MAYDGDPTGWQRSPNSPWDLGILYDRLESLSRRIDGIEQRVVSGTIITRTASATTGNFGISMSKSPKVSLSIPAPAAYSSVLVIATYSGNAEWDPKKGGTGGSGEWRTFTSSITVDGIEGETGGSSYLSTTSTADGAPSLWNISAPTTVVSLTNDQAGSSITVQGLSWTETSLNATAFSSIKDQASATLNAAAIFIR